MVTLVNRAKMTIVSTGTGTLTLGPAVDGFQSFGAAGVADGDMVRYVIEDGNAWEIGTGIYAAAGPSLTRSPSESSDGGSAIALAGAAVAFITATTADIVQPGDNITKLANDAGYTANPGTVTSVAAAAGAGISVSGAPVTSAGTLTITNTAPHQPTNLGLTGTGNSRTLTSSTGSNVTLPVATPTNAGLMATGDKSKLDGIAAGAQVNTVTSVAGKTGAVTLAVGDVSSAVATTDTRLTNSREWTAATITQAEAEAGTATTRRAFTAERVRQAILGWWNGSADKTKLDGIAAGAQVNVATNLGSSGTGATRTITSSTGSNTTITYSAADIGAAASTHAHADATTTVSGFMSGADKSKLNGIAAGAQVNVATNLDYSATASSGSVTSSTGSNSTLPAATTSFAGLLTAADKSKLDGIAAGAQVNSVTSVAGKTGAVTLSATDVGAASASHSHGNITSDGRIGSSANLLILTGSSGILTAKPAGSTSQYLRGDGNWGTPPNTTYSEISTAEIDAGTASTSRTITGRRIGYALAKTADLVHSHTAATTSAAGFMSPADKAKLDGLSHSATNLSVTGGTTAGPTINSSTGTNATLPVASETASGVVTTGAQTFAGVKTFSSTITGSISGNAGTAATLQTARSINGTSFNGSANITTANWGTSRMLMIGNAGKGVNGSDNVSWTLAEIGAAASNATVNLTGNQSVSGIKTFTSALAVSGTLKAAGRLYAGTTNPSNTTRLNYDGNLHVNALTAVGDVTAFSDARLKSDLERIPDALAKVSRLTGYTFTRKDTGARQTGVIAQDVQQVLPEAVIECGDHLALAYGNMVGLLIEAIKDLKAELEELKNGAS